MKISWAIRRPRLSFARGRCKGPAISVRASTIMIQHPRWRERPPDVIPGRHRHPPRTDCVLDLPPDAMGQTLSAVLPTDPPRRSEILTAEGLLFRARIAVHLGLDLIFSPLEVSQLPNAHTRRNLYFAPVEMLPLAVGAALQKPASSYSRDERMSLIGFSANHAIQTQLLASRLFESRLTNSPQNKGPGHMSHQETFFIQSQSPRSSLPVAQ